MNDKLSKVKTALQLKSDEYDNLLELYLEDASDALKLLLSVQGDLPAELEHIVRAVAVKKFNRLKNEGMSSYSQDGESITFNSNDFDDFKDEIEQYRKDNNGLNQGMWTNPYEVHVR